MKQSKPATPDEPVSEEASPPPRRFAIDVGDTVRFLRRTHSARGHVRNPGDTARVTHCWEGRIIDVEWDGGLFKDVVIFGGGVVEKVETEP